MKKQFIHQRIIYHVPSWEICTWSMLTVTALLLYIRKLIPLWCLPSCDNLITLGCHQIFFFLCFSKVKSRRDVCAFWVPSWPSLDQIDWHSERMLSQCSLTEPCLQIVIIPLIKKLCLFVMGSSTCIFSLFVCQNSETRFLRSTCEEMDVTLIIFSGLNLVGVSLIYGFMKLCKHIHIFETQ